MNDIRKQQITWPEVDRRKPGPDPLTVRLLQLLDQRCEDKPETVLELIEAAQGMLWRLGESGWTGWYDAHVELGAAMAEVRAMTRDEESVS